MLMSAVSHYCLLLGAERTYIYWCLRVICSVSNQESWTQHSSDIITRSQKVRAQAKQYRDLIDQMLCKTATEMTNQWNVVNAAFSDRIREYVKARTDLETHLAKVKTRNPPCIDCRL